MTRRFSDEPELSTYLEEADLMVVPSDGPVAVKSITRPMRPLPRWLALIKEPPMRTSSSLAVGSPTARVAAIIAATFLLALMVAGAGIAGSRLLAAEGDIVVDPDGDGTVTTITAAVAMAADGDTILVRPGTYDESVVITTDITIRGDGDREDITVELSVPLGRSGFVVGDNPDNPRAFHFEDSDATLEGMTLRGESARIVISGGAPLLQDLVLEGVGQIYGLDPVGNYAPSGLEINDGTTATIKDSVLTDTAIDIETGSSPTIIGNEFSIGSIWMQGAGVDPVIRDNVFDSSVRSAIDIGGGAQPTVERNTIERTQTGIAISEGGHRIPDTGTDPVIRGNTITGATFDGISISSGASATIADNVLLDNRVGINVLSGAIVKDNRVEGGVGGIVILAGSPTLIDNSVEGVSGPGISIVGGAGPTLTGNTSCNNRENLRIVEGATPDIDDTNEICPDAPAEATE